MDAEKAKSIKLYVDKYHVGVNQEHYLGRLVIAINDAFKELDDKHLEQLNDVLRRMFFYSQVPTLYIPINTYPYNGKVERIIIDWVASSILGINPSNEIIRDKEIVCSDAKECIFDYALTIVTDACELQGVILTPPPAQTTEGDNPKGRPNKTGIDIKGFNGSVFTNDAKQQAFMVWRKMTSSHSNVTAKTLWTKLNEGISDNRFSETDWLVNNKDTIQFMQDRLSFSSLGSGGFMRDFKNAEDYLNNNNEN